MVKYFSFQSLFQHNVPVDEKILTSKVSHPSGTGKTRGTGEPIIAARVGRKPSLWEGWAWMTLGLWWNLLPNSGLIFILNIFCDIIKYFKGEFFSLFLLRSDINIYYTAFSFFVIEVIYLTLSYLLIVCYCPTMGSFTSHSGSCWIL